MFLRRLDDYQSWQVIHRGTSILIDPWLTSDAISGVFNRVHGDGFVTWDDLQREAGTISAVILCTSVDDHLRPDTLSHFGDVPIWGPVKAAKAALFPKEHKTGLDDYDKAAWNRRFDQLGITI